MTGSSEGEAIAFPQAGAMWRGVLNLRKRASVVWERDSAQGPWQLSPQPSPQSHEPVSPHMTPDCSTLPPVGGQGEWR